MKYINVIESFYPSLSKQEKKIADYILEKKGLVSFKSLQEIGSEINVGEATIVRFVRKIGFNGFRELKLNIAKEDFPVSEVEYDDYIDNIHLNIDNTIQNTKSLINKEKLEEAFTLIEKADRIFIYGVGSSGIATQELQNKLLRYGKTAIIYSDVHFQIMSAAVVRERDLVIAVSLSGETADLIDTVKLAKKNKAKIIAITNHILSPLAQMSDCVLLTAGKETLLDGGSLVAKMSQLYLIDVLCTGYALTNKERAIKMKQNTAQAIIIKKT